MLVLGFWPEPGTCRTSPPRHSASVYIRIQRWKEPVGKILTEVPLQALSRHVNYLRGGREWGRWTLEECLGLGWAKGKNVLSSLQGLRGCSSSQEWRGKHTKASQGTERLMLVAGKDRAAGDTQVEQLRHVLQVPPAQDITGWLLRDQAHQSPPPAATQTHGAHQGSGSG